MNLDFLNHHDLVLLTLSDSGNTFPGRASAWMHLSLSPHFIHLLRHNSLHSSLHHSSPVKAPPTATDCTLGRVPITFHALRFPFLFSKSSVHVEKWEHWWWSSCTRPPRIQFYCCHLIFQMPVQKYIYTILSDGILPEVESLKCLRFLTCTEIPPSGLHNVVTN